MKHSIKITIILISLFLVTQMIGLYVVNYYSPVKIINGERVEISAPSLPYGFQTPQLKDTGDFSQTFFTILFAFVIAVSFLLLLTKLRAEFFLKLWFFIVVTIALGISLNAIFPNFSYKLMIVSILACILSFTKIYQKRFRVHNATELLIYPGIAAVFVPIFNIYTIFFMLILISIYDMWAVWHSGIMQKMVKYQINKLNILSGFFIPYISPHMKVKMQKMGKISAKSGKIKKIRVNIAILGGGDVVFPIISAGVVLVTFGFVQSLFVVAGATFGLSSLILFSEKKKFYPAMPFITAGIFAGMVLGYLLF